ncbi:MAG: AraC family transcriptional regulator ligand-binding domain-containing protein [Moraxellaceae bacterium]
MRYPVTYLRLLARELRLDDAGQRRLLADTRLSPADIQQLDREIGAQDYLRVIGNALALADRPGFGLEMGARLSLAAHGPLGQLLSSGPTLAAAWQALVRYHGLRVPLVQLACRTEGERFVIVLALEAAPEAVGQCLAEAMAVTVQRGIELVIGRRLTEARWLFAGPEPAHAALYARHLRGQWRFGAAETALRLPRALMETPNPFRDPEAWAQALAHCDALSRSRAAAEAVSTTGERITRLLQQHPGRLWTLAEVAAHFHLSPRTLMRRLKAEGLSYQQLLDAELFRQAVPLLQTPGHGVESVAVALGYQEATAFRRAFRRWAGVSPSAWLAEQAPRD